MTWLPFLSLLLEPSSAMHFITNLGSRSTSRGAMLVWVLAVLGAMARSRPILPHFWTSRAGVGRRT